MVHACYGMGCPYEGLDGECHGRGYKDPHAPCNRESDYDDAIDEYDTEDEDDA